MKVLDLFCGGGGASVGINQAGFEVSGVDNKKQKDYPFEFIENDVFKLNGKLEEYDAYWASCPCQNYSIGTIGFRMNGKTYPDLISATRELLLQTGKPFVLENVVGSPLRKDLLLCGEMFDLPIHRHRIFEIHGFNVTQLIHEKHKRSVCKGQAVGVWSGGKPGCFGNREKYLNSDWKAPSLLDYQKAMGISWITTKKTMEQAIPPIYSKYIFSSLHSIRTDTESKA